MVQSFQILGNSGILLETSNLQVQYLYNSAISFPYYSPVKPGKGKSLASVLKYHGKMWYKFISPFRISHLPNPPPPGSKTGARHAADSSFKGPGRAAAAPAPGPACDLPGAVGWETGPCSCVEAEMIGSGRVWTAAPLLPTPSQSDCSLLCYARLLINFFCPPEMLGTTEGVAVSAPVGTSGCTYIRLLSREPSTRGWGGWVVGVKRVSLENCGGGGGGWLPQRGCKP